MSQYNLVLKFPFYLIIFKDSSYFQVLKVTFQTTLQQSGFTLFETLPNECQYEKKVMIMYYSYL